MNSSRFGTITLALVSLYQWGTTILVKNLFLKFNLNLFWYSFMMSSQVLLVSSERRNQLLPLCSSPEKAAGHCIASLNLVFSRLNTQRDLSHFSFIILSRSFTIFVALLWILSNCYISISYIVYSLIVANKAVHNAEGAALTAYNKVEQSFPLTCLQMCLIHHEVLFATRAHYWLIFILSPTRIPRSFAMGLLSSLILQSMHTSRIPSSLVPFSI